MISIHKVVLFGKLFGSESKTYLGNDRSVLVWLNPGSNCKIQRILSFLTSKHNIKKYDARLFIEWEDFQMVFAKLYPWSEIGSGDQITQLMETRAPDTIVITFIGNKLTVSIM